MDDSGRRVVPRSYTALEQRIFDCCRPFLGLCCRSQIRLAPAMARLLPAGFENRADIEFQQHVNACYVKLTGGDTPPQYKTSAYLIRIRELWKDGPGLLASFGVGGPETLIWNHLLCSTRRDLLDGPRFVMVEMDRLRIPKRPENIRFAEPWKFQVLIDHPLDGPPRTPSNRLGRGLTAPHAPPSSR